MIRPSEDDYLICQIGFETLLGIQREAQEHGRATRWSSVDALRSQVRDNTVILQSLMREERNGATWSYRCLVLFSKVDGGPSGGLTTIDLIPARFESLERLDQYPEVSRAFARIFALASGGITMMSKA